jgi:phosphoglycolate phosphatase
MKAVIVDLDGTMVDTLGDFEVALNRTLIELALPEVNSGFVERAVGKGSEHLILSVLRHQLALPEVKAREKRNAETLYNTAWARYQHHYLAINGQFSNVYPGVMEGLRQMQDQGLRLACLTNKPLSFATPLLADKDLSGFFACTFGGDSFERKKPDPLPLLKTCEALGALPAQTLMVGDSTNDAQAARAAGCPVVMVRYGYNHGQPVEAVDADGHWDSLTDFIAWHRQFECR